jgi:hypothetical protein
VAQYQEMKDKGGLSADQQADCDEAKRRATEEAKAKQGAAK